MPEKKTKPKQKSVSKTKPQAKPKANPRDRIQFPHTEKTDTPEAFAHAVIKALWLNRNPGKTEEDFEELIRRQEEEAKAKKEQNNKG